MTISAIDEYLNKSSWMVNENANQVHSYAKLKGYIADNDMREYALKYYPKHIVDLHTKAYIHIHDLANGIVPYCCGSDLMELLVKGLWTPQTVSGPPQHLASALDQLVNFFTAKQDEWAGAQAVGSFNTLMAPYVRKYKEELIEEGVTYDVAVKLTIKYVKQCLQMFIFNMNQQSRSSNETPFTNIIFNAMCPDNLAEDPVHLERYSHLGYADFEEEAMMILRYFNEALSKGDKEGKPFTFPIPTINLVPGMNWDHPVWIEVAAVEAKFGYYYWMNFIGTGIDPNTVQAMCCRLTIDLSQLPPAGGRWANAGGTGSLGIVSINMSKMGHFSGTEEELLANITDMMGYVKEAIDVKERLINSTYKNGLMPITEHYGVDFKRYFRTIGVIGLHEMCMNFNGKPIWKNTELIAKVLTHMREWTRSTQKETGKLWNLEMTPGESASTRFAQYDIDNHRGIITQGTKDAPYYTTLLVPPSVDMSMMEKIDVENDLLQLFTGGTVSRNYIGERNPNPKALWMLIQRIATYSQIPYFDFAATFSRCIEEECGRTVSGNINACPTCGAQTDVYQRITGYYRPSRSANYGKYQEIQDRKYLKTGYLTETFNQEISQGKHMASSGQ